MVAPPGRPLLLGLGAFVLLVLAGGFLWGPLWVFLSLAVGLAAFWVLLLNFFRDPERVPGPGLVAPADGRVLLVREEGRRVRIATFMNVTNVHVNRTPLGGYLVRVDDRGGPRKPAFSPEAEGNSQKRYLMGTPIGLVEVVQITGIVARRCVAYRRSGTPLRRAERFGMIVFGSRVDVVVDRSHVRVVVAPGDRVWAGTSTLAEVLP